MDEEELRSMLIVLYFMAFIFSRWAMVPPAWYLAASNNKETGNTITLPFDVLISIGFALPLAMLRAITSDLSSQWMINSATLYAFVIFFFFVPLVAVPMIHLYVRLTAAVATDLVFWVRGIGKLREI